MNAIIIAQPTNEPRLMIDGSYMVDSRTHTLVSYKVRKLEHGWECNCIAAAHRRTCWHVTAVLALEAATEAPELVEDMVAITDYLQDTGESKEWSPNYSDGTPKPYSQSDSHMEMIRKAQASWID